jgi:hypothetical protein
MNYKNLIDMKKILLSGLLLLFFSGIFAQSLSLLDTNGIAIAPGATIQFLGDPNDDVIQAIVLVKNNSSAALEVKVKKVINAGDTLSGTVNTFCWGLCFPPSTYTSPFAQTIQAGATCDQFYGDYNPITVPGTSKISYVFFDMNNTNDSVAVTVKYNASPAGIKDDMLKLVKLSGAYPNPAINIVYVDYAIPESITSASIVITNMLGAKVKEVNLADRSGKARIATTDLINGIYFYSLVADDQLLLTRKFVVRR